ncbi:MAG: YicC family protein [Flavobacteriales bacterium]|nr:YicC family protein [Flavobacteriales bacterium]MCC6937515.1 YicC family protein [Flavobacteriales bacterium]
MLRSMTGFGRAEGVVKDRKVTVEVRSLNSKQLDLYVKLPSAYRERDHEVRQWIGEQAVRGKVEVFVAGESLQATKHTTFDRELIRAYYQELKEIADTTSPDAAADLFAYVLRLPDVATTVSDRADDEEWSAVRGLIENALTAFQEFRGSEGSRLEEELMARVKGIEQLLTEVEAMDSGRANRTRERLLGKLTDLRAEVNEDRFAQELIYYLEKLDITEEKVRLRSHCTYFMETVKSTDQQGRKLGFICQEMGREINTIGSKANDATMQQLVVRMKDELEKVKEQVLNVL